MPSTGLITVSGHGTHLFPSVVTPNEVDLHVTAAGSAHIFGSAEPIRVQHFGHYGGFYVNDATASLDVTFFAFVNFENEDWRPPDPGFAYHGMFWDLQAGCEMTLRFTWA